MSLAGIVSVNHFGVWRSYCKTSKSKSDATVASNICNYLGYGEYTAFKKVEIGDQPLLIKYMDQLKTVSFEIFPFINRNISSKIYNL